METPSNQGEGPSGKEFSTFQMALRLIFTSRLALNGCLYLEQVPTPVLG